MEYGLLVAGAVLALSIFALVLSIFALAFGVWVAWPIWLGSWVKRRILYRKG